MNDRQSKPILDIPDEHRKHLVDLWERAIVSVLHGVGQGDRSYAVRHADSVVLAWLERFTISQGHPYREGQR
jgi:hypothetical protein